LLQRLIPVLLLLSTLAGCFHAELNGSVAGATITITELRSGTTVGDPIVSLDESVAQSTYPDWGDWNATLRHWFLGMLTLAPEHRQRLDPDQLYLVTASGGFDTDLLRDLAADDIPTAVDHQWHAIMSGEQLLEENYKVSALTEAVWRWIAADVEQSSNSELLARLDEIASALVPDINQDSRIDYSDILSWTRILVLQNPFQGDFESLNAFSEALVLGSSDSALDALAEAIIGPTTSTLYWRQLAADFDDKTYASADFLYAVVPDPNFCIAGELTEAARQRQLQALNQSRALHGLPAVVYSSQYDIAVQESALIQKANNYLSHFPVPEDNCFTTAGAEAAASGNLTGASSDLDPAEDMVGFINDSRNVSLLAAAGHRRSSLNPFMTYTSYGQVQGRSTQKVFSFAAEPTLSPDIQVDYVAFPYGNYPYLFISTDPEYPTPWSFTVVEDKQTSQGNLHDYFADARVSVTRLSDGATLATSNHYSDTSFFGVPNFFSWQVSDWEFDTRYRVDISNVSMASGEVRDFSYEVFLNFAKLVDRTEPLESGDRQTVVGLEGSIADGDDRDSYMLDLADSVTFSGSSQYSNQGFFIILYGPDKQLVIAEDSEFTVNLEAGTYTVVISSCSELSCYPAPVPTNYLVDIL
jgi:uncharacterized protein YkwD